MEWWQWVLCFLAFLFCFNAFLRHIKLCVVGIIIGMIIFWGYHYKTGYMLSNKYMWLYAGPFALAMLYAILESIIALFTGRLDAEFELGSSSKKSRRSYERRDGDGYLHEEGDNYYTDSDGDGWYKEAGGYRKADSSGKFISDHDDLIK